MAGFHLSWTHPKLAKHRFGGARGTGVIALAPIRRGELLSRFGGYVMTFEEFLRLPPALQEMPYQIADDLLFGPISRQGLTVSEYYNHSCDPNAGSRRGSGFRLLHVCINLFVRLQSQLRNTSLPQAC
ncbi:MAG: hypothetical protein MUC53_14825 [Candidatus Contendobacter sp.]|nr:hypothetical protein [Candidatus Contendobacter sp.]